MQLFSSAVVELQLLEQVEYHLDKGDLEDWICERVGRARNEIDSTINFLEQVQQCA